ncbi:MAG: PEP-CTERM sorting domain-containing protein [Phycisphaerales bacterium]|nr:PEP-CTERM sorting domain-containing protein [Phycisphaerales bacterium]
MLKHSMRSWLTGIAIAIVPASIAAATVVPFEESFDANASGWAKDSVGATLLDWTATGGSDGGGFVSSVFNFQNSAENSTPAILRGVPSASGGAFVGDWITDGVDNLSAYVKHDAGFPLTFFMRVAPFGGPGAVGVVFAPVPSDTWTKINWGIFDGNSQTIYEGTTFATAFSNVARVQIGVLTPAALAMQDVDVTFSADQVAVTPEPVSLGILGLGTLLVGVRRRRMV